MPQSSAITRAERVSARMKLIRSSRTAPEQTLRKALRSAGVRFRTPVGIAGRPDLVVAGQKIAIFVDGDYWHGNQWLRRKHRSLEDQLQYVSNKDYWVRKLSRNIARDFAVTAGLLQQGWKVLRFWESDVERSAADCAALVQSAAEARALPDLQATSLARRTVAEFFAGIGLMRLAFERQGWTVVFANDIEPKKQAMYQAHFGAAHGEFAPGDIHALSADRVPDVAIATASFPCNDLSLAGARRGLAGSQSSAFWGFASVLRKMGKRKPPMVLLENVPGLLSSNGGQDFEAVLLALNKLGYTVDVLTVDAIHFVPQSRARLFVIGVARELARTGSCLCDESDIRPHALTNFILSHQNIRWNLRPLPSLPARKSVLADMLDELPDGHPLWWSAERAKYLLNQMSSRHRGEAEDLIASRRWSYATVFRRVRQGKSMAELRTDGTAGCLRTPRGGSGRQILLKAGFGTYSVRLLSAQECARLMGADEYSITASLNQALFGFGDAVCVPAVEWIVQHYFTPLAMESIRGTILGRE